MKISLSIVKTTLIYGALLLLLMSAVSCSSDSGGSSGAGAVITSGTMSVQANPTSIVSNGTATITATVMDSSGNPVADGTSVSFTLSSSAYGSLSNTTVTTAGGVAATTFTAGNVSGSVTITAASGTISNFTTLSVGSGSAGPITVQANPTTITANGTSTITATIKDSNGNLVADGTSVTFSLSSVASGTLSNTTVTTAGGVATTTFTASSVSGIVTITATSGGNSNATSLTVTVSVGSIQFVSATPKILGIKGAGQSETSIILFRVSDVNGDPVNGAVVNFVMTGPNGGEFIGDIDLTPATASAATISGIASVVLHSGTIAGPVTITATTTIANGPISTSATPISIGGGVPSASHFTLARMPINLEGFVWANLQSTVSAYLADRFGNYNVLDATSVSFYTEAGAIDAQGITGVAVGAGESGIDATPGNTGEADVIIRTQHLMPQIVPPAVAGDAVSTRYFDGLNEPFYTAGTRTFNPRDGWVTIVAATKGEETFLDENHDGLFTRSYKDDKCPYSASINLNTNSIESTICECDGGVVGGYAGFVLQGEKCTDPLKPGGKRSEGFLDLPEDPFIDVNDDGLWDDGQTLGHPFELFIDENGNGIFDSTNGKWDGPGCKTAGCENNKTIWNKTTMVFSGAPRFYANPVNNCYTRPDCTDFDANYPGAQFASAPANLVSGGTGTFRVIVGDSNLNTLQGGSTITVTASICSGGQIIPSVLTIDDGPSRGPTFFDFSVICLIPPGTVTVEVLTPKGSKNTTSINVPLI